jgi:hypothetical protein
VRHRKYHILRYEVVANSPMLHHGVAYACTPSDEPKVAALGANLGPYDRFGQGMLCESFMMVGGQWVRVAVAVAAVVVRGCKCVGVWAWELLPAPAAPVPTPVPGRACVCESTRAPVFTPTDTPAAAAAAAGAQHDRLARAARRWPAVWRQLHALHRP